MNKESGFGTFTASLHTHVRSQFDADINAYALAARIKELGGKGCAITDHGVLSSIEDYRPAFKDNDLKLIPGCELYVDGGAMGRLHLVVLAVNDHGYKGICKIVTESNKNITTIGKSQIAVITKEKLSEIMPEYKDDIIALSGCMQGVICSIFRINEPIYKTISKLEEKKKNYFSKDSEKYKKLVSELTVNEETLKDVIFLRDKTKTLAESKFTKREKAIEKAAKAGEDVSILQKELEEDKAKAIEAANKLESVKKALDKARKDVSAAKKAVKEADEIVLKYESVVADIKVYTSNIQSKESLEKLAFEETKKYLDIFGKDNFYAEMQYHGIESEKECFIGMYKIAKSLNIPLVATNDVHILTKSNDERLKRCILRSLRFENDEFAEESTGDDELYLKDNNELAQMLLEILPEDAVNESISNIDVIFNRCNVEFITGKHYPKFSKNGNADDILDEEIKKGIKWRYPNGLDDVHKARLEYEVSIIKSMGYSDYHLIVKDFLEYGRLLGYVPKDKLDEAPLTIAELKEYISQNNWTNGGMVIGPGRGSAVGSLVCYILGITNLDPLKYDLLFERFLNPERISMPDIDSDIANTTRYKVIEYVKKKYGENAVCGIMTTDALAPKGAIEKASKYYGIHKNGNSLITLGRTINKMIPSDIGTKFSSIVDENGKIAADKNGITLKEYLLKKNANNSDAVNIIKWAAVLEGAFTTYGAHAAGIVISDNEDISEYLPLRMNTNLGMYTTQCDMVQVEDNGLLKFDFLGLKTLDIITETIRMIEKNHGIIIDPLKIDLSDSNVYKNIFALGKTNSVFQLESIGMKTMLKRFRPESFEDLIILVSMYRPGPLQYLDEVIDVKNGKKEMSFLCPELKPILEKTYGAIVYQEQVMEICQKLAGYTLGGADMVRRYMSKKKADKLAHEREKFVIGCKEKGIAEDVTNTLFDQMMDFAYYAFNKSHAAVYAFIAYITAWLKYYYSSEFYASALNWCDNTDKMIGLMNEANESKIAILAPSVNNSLQEFCVVNGEIHFSLSMIKGINMLADSIIKERNNNGPYTSLKDFVYRVNPSVKVITSLIDAGAFDEFHDSRVQLKTMVEDIKPVITDIRDKEMFVKSATLCLPYVESMTDEELVNLQKENNLRVDIKTATTADKLTKRIENANAVIETSKTELSHIRFHKIEEDKKERMSLEKQLLGIYVTDHPMNYYPDPSTFNADTISNALEDTRVLYGIITDLNVKKRKKDNAEMGFFTLEDKTGKYKCAAFVKQYAKYKNLIKEGEVVILKGSVNVEEIDRGDEIEYEYTFFVEEVKGVNPKKAAVLMQVSCFASFHIDIEEIFKKEYAEENGRVLYIHDKALNEVREMNYCVSDNVLNLPQTTEIY